MDRIDAMRVFVTALDEGSLAGAGRRLRKSPAAVTRAIAFLESYVGTPLLHRTTRTIKHPGNHRYAWPLTKHAVMIDTPQRYPKQWTDGPSF